MRSFNLKPSTEEFKKQELQFTIHCRKKWPTTRNKYYRNSQFTTLEMKKITSQFKKEVEITKVTNLADLEDKGPQDQEITEKEKFFEDLKLRLRNSEGLASKKPRFVVADTP